MFDLKWTFIIYTHELLSCSCTTRRLKNFNEIFQISMTCYYNAINGCKNWQKFNENQIYFVYHACLLNAGETKNGPNLILERCEVSNSNK